MNKEPLNSIPCYSVSSSTVGSMPEWVRRVEHHMIKEKLPFKIGRDSKIQQDPYQRGKSLGYSFWFWRTPRKDVRTRVTASGWDARMEGRLKAIKKTMVRHLEKEPFDDAVRFFEGFAVAAKKGIVDDKMQVNTAPPHCRLYSFLMDNWWTVESMKNRTQLYHWLCKQLGKACLPDLESFQKMCVRFGIKMTKRGRPAR